MIKINEIKEIVNLNSEEIGIRYFAKDESLVDRIIDEGEMLEIITNLQDRISKAIEYIEQKEVSIYYQELGLHQTNGKQDLLTILNGVDKE